MESLLVVVMVLALVLAVGMSLFAWRVLRRDRSHTDARVAHLRAMAAEQEPEWDEPAFRHEPEAEVTYEAPHLFSAAAPPPARTSWSALVAVVVLFMAVGAGSVYALYGHVPAFPWPSAQARAGAAPLELVALTHRREPGGEFVVTGLVQNPATGQATPALSAVIYLFGTGDQYATSGAAAIDVPTLAPGDQSPFTVRVADVGTVSRYRLGFRRQDGGTIAHVDRRGTPLAGTTVAIVEDGAR